MTASRRVLIVVGVLIAVALGLPWGGVVPNAAAQEVLVTDAVPGTADQGTLNLDVTITGEGFARRANAKFYLAGTTNPAGVTVNSTRFVNSTKLVANINVAAGAVPGDFDIEVKNADGRTGKGTELFAVLKKIDPCTLPDPELTLSTNVADEPGFPGYFDGTFGSGGKVIGPRFTHTRYIEGGGTTAVDHAGRTIVVGYRDFPCTAGQSTAELIATRYLPDGSPDPDFGTDGLVAFAFGGGSGVGNSVAVQADNKIVIAGQAKPSKASVSLPVIIRLLENGALDQTFDGDGVFWMTVFGTKTISTAVSVALQPTATTEKIVAVGMAPNAGFSFVCRLTANGALDGTFNGTGYIRRPGPGWLRAVAVQSFEADDQRIVVAGYGLDALNHYLPTLLRYTNAGLPDTSFGGGSGIVQTTFHVEDGRSLGDYFKAVAIDSMNRIVAVGSMEYCLVAGDFSTAQYRVVLARYDLNGNPDTSFGDGAGRVWAPQGTIGKDTANSVAVQDDWRIVVAGHSNPLAAGVLWRFNPDGSADPAFFGSGGWAMDSIADGAVEVQFSGVALGPDGRIVCGGFIATAASPLIHHVVLARFWQ
jgi:uncharacterized delta-60 repeat protein